jgi:hypothetical protein
VDKATVDLSRGRSAQVVFEANKFGALKHGPGNSHGHGGKNRYPLDFDPRGELVELVASDSTVAFSGEMLAQIDALPQDTGDDGVITLVSSGADADATGEAVISVDDAGETTLTVSAAQLPPGDYQIFVNGTFRATLTLTDDGTGATAGEIVFATLTTGTEVELDFPLTGLLEIKQADTVFLSGSLD